MLKNNIVTDLACDLKDSLKNKMLARKFIVGERYEVYVPAAKQVEHTFGATFADQEGYSFTVTKVLVGMVWTKDITYGTTIRGTVAPPPHPVIGSPLPSSALKYVRPVTDE